MATNDCIVHSRKNLSNFHTTINRLRGENKFTNNVYQELPKRCCSCKGKTGFKTINLNILREMCEDIVMSIDFTLKFRFSSNMNRFWSTEEEEEKNENNQYLNDPTDDEESHNSESTSDNEDINKNATSTVKTTSIPHMRIASRGTRYQNTSANQEYDLNEILKVIPAINLIRRGKSYTKEIYYELPKRCCSCNGKTGLNIIDINVLINICEEIQSKVLKSSYDLALSFELETDFRERRARIGRFIGKKGENLRSLEDKYNIRLHIINNQSSNQKYFQKLIEIQENNSEIVYLFLTKKDKSITNEIPIEEIKEQIIEKWKEANIEPIDDELFHLVSLSNESKKPFLRYRRKLGYFIGKNGQHLRNLQNQYNINI
ncbi:hypothetical protein I4U23_022143 [Adineta vaga]|nr:hypothetical protein I4U23_022143 [Adineta vaga]